MCPKSTIPRVNLLHAHGSPTRYLNNHGCRCVCCRAAKVDHNHRMSTKETPLQRQHRHDRGSKWSRTHPEKCATYQRAARQRYPERFHARSRTNNAIVGGHLTRQPCEVCDTLPTHAHHDDYTKPLDVRWLCQAHHFQLHKEEQP